MSDAQRRNKIKACLLFAALGDAIGYRNGKWEFEKNTEKILHEAKSMGGIAKIRIDPEAWPVSDDTVMHMATAWALVCAQSEQASTAIHQPHYAKLISSTTSPNGNVWQEQLKALDQASKYMGGASTFDIYRFVECARFCTWIACRT